MTSIFIIRDNSYDLLIESDEPMYSKAVLTILASRFYPVDQHSSLTAETIDDIYQFSRDHNVFFINIPADKLECPGRLPAMVITAKQALDAGDRLGDYKSGVDYFYTMAFSYTSDLSVQPHLIAELINTLRRICY
jgi:hypothetical protein